MIAKLTVGLAALCLLTGAAFAQGGAKPSDPQIAHIAYTAGQLDIDAAKQALAITKNKDVKAFADDMVRDHTAVNKQAIDLVTKLKVKPEDNDTSKALTKAAAERGPNWPSSPALPSTRLTLPMRLPTTRPSMARSRPC